MTILLCEYPTTKSWTKIQHEIRKKGLRENNDNIYATTRVWKGIIKATPF